MDSNQTINGYIKEQQLTDEHSELESRVGELEINRHDLHHQFNAIERQLESVETIYQTLKESLSELQSSDYMEEQLSELSSLITIARKINQNV